MFTQKSTRILALTALAAFFAAPSPALRAGDHVPAITPGRTAAAPARNPVGEALLAMKVRTRLLTEVKDDALPIKVDVSGGTVTLTGQMKKLSSLELAENTAKSVEGVKHLDSRLTLAANENANPVKSASVKSGHEVADALLETKVKTKLLEIGRASCRERV